MTGCNRSVLPTSSSEKENVDSRDIMPIVVAFDMLFSFHVVDKVFIAHDLIEKRKLYCSMLFDHTSHDKIEINFQSGSSYLHWCSCYEFVLDFLLSLYTLSKGRMYCSMQRGSSKIFKVRLIMIFVEKQKMVFDSLL